MTILFFISIYVVILIAYFTGKYFGRKEEFDYVKKQLQDRSDEGKLDVVYNHFELWK